MELVKTAVEMFIRSGGVPCERADVNSRNDDMAQSDVRASGCDGANFHRLECVIRSSCLSAELPQMVVAVYAVNTSPFL